MNNNKPLPSIFHRLFLSHLLVVCLCFIAAGLLFGYLFAPGVKVFVVRNPIIIFPTILVLLGFAGLLALWTAGAIALPLERLTAAVRSHSPLEGFHRILPKAGSEEAANLTQRLLEQFTVTEIIPQETSSPATAMKSEILIVETDISFIITKMNRAARDYFGLNVEGFSETHLFSLFDSASASDGSPISDFHFLPPEYLFPAIFHSVKSDGSSAYSGWDQVAVSGADLQSVGRILFGTVLK